MYTQVSVTPEQFNTMICFYLAESKKDEKLFFQHPPSSQNIIAWTWSVWKVTNVVRDHNISCFSPVVTFKIIEEHDIEARFSRRPIWECLLAWCAMYRPDEGSKYVWNVGHFILDYEAQHPRGKLLSRDILIGIILETSKFWGFHGGDYVDCGSVGCNVVYILVCGCQRFGGIYHLHIPRVFEIRSFESLITTCDIRLYSITILQTHNRLLKRDQCYWEQSVITVL